MPAEDCLWGKQRTDLDQRLTPQDLSFHSQSTALFIGKQNSLLTVQLPQYFVLGDQIVNHQLLLTIHPLAEDRAEHVPVLPTVTITAAANVTSYFRNVDGTKVVSNYGETDGDASPT